jgi:hypothetical protein
VEINKSILKDSIVLRKAQLPRCLRKHTVRTGLFTKLECGAVDKLREEDGGFIGHCKNDRAMPSSINGTVHI